MPFYELVSRRRRTRVSIVVLTLGTLFTLVTCKLNDLLSPVGATAAGQPKLVFSTGNAVKLGSPLTVAATVTGADGVALTSSQYHLDIVSVDNVVLARDTAGNVVTKGVGNGILKVRIITAALPAGGDTLVDTIKVDYAGIKIATPVDSVVGLGDATHAIVVNGLDVNGVVRGTISSNLTFTSRDTSIDSVETGGIIKGKKNGSPYVVANYAGAFPSSDSVKVVVHQLATSFRLAATTMAVGTLNTPRAVTAFVPVDKNGKDDTYPGTVITYTTDSASVLAFNASNQLSGLKNGVGHITSAKADGATSVASLVVTVTVAQVAAKLAFVEQPPASAIAGQAGAVQVSIADSSGASISNASGNVALAITSGTGTGGATLCNAATVASTATCGQSSISTNAVNGVATFTAGIDKAGTGYTLLASAGTATATSSAITVAAGSASTLVFTKQPVGALANSTDSVKVAVTDGSGNVITTATNPITIAIASGGPAGTPLKGTLTQAAVNGVAAFAPSIDSAGTYTLSASTAGLGSVASRSFTIISGTKTRLLFSVQPVAAAPGVAMSPVKAIIVDAAGNVVTSAFDSVSIAIGTNPGGTLTGTTKVQAQNGVATFSNLSINNAAIGYTLTATSGTLTSATSSAFNVTTTGATKLVFTGQPTSAASQATLGTITVAIQTAASGTTTNTDNVTLSITSGSGTYGAHLIGSATAAAVSGTATFTGLSIDSASANNYTLTATATGLASSTSSTFTVSAGAAAKLGFAIQPMPTTGGATFSPVVKVAVLDAAGNVVTSSAASIAMALSGGAGGTLGGTTTVAAASGYALFTDLNVNKVGTAYQLQATSAGLTGASSNTFNVNLGPAAKLVGLAQPSSMTSGLANTTLTVGFTDLGGNTVTTATSNVNVAIVSGTGTPGATLSGTLTKAAASGQVSFTDLTIDKAGTGYQIIAYSSGYPGVITSAFAVAPGAASKIGFASQPTNTLQNAVINNSTGGVQVAIQDAAGNTVTSSSASVTVALGSNPGAGTLTGTLTASATSGVATFSSLAVNASGTGYTLNATSSGLSGLTSNPFNIEAAAGTATKLAFTKQPATASGGSTQSVQVSVTDANGVVVTSATNSVTLTITSGTGTPGASLCNPTSSCGQTTMSASAASGVASFTVGVDKANAGYTFTAASSGLTSATSSAFGVVVGTPLQIAFQVIPKNTYLNAPLNPDTLVRIGVLDAGGNVVSSATDGMTVSLNSGSGSLLGSTSFVASAGIAQIPANVMFSQVTTASVKVTDVTRSLAVISSSFSVSPFGPAAQVVWTTPPWTGSRHGYYLTAVSEYDTTAVATIEDRFGNVVTSSNDSVAVTISSPAGISTVNARVQASAGIAAFPSLAVNQGGSSLVALASDVTNTSVTAAASPVAVSVSSYGFPIVDNDFITAFALSSSGAPALFLADSSGGSIWTAPAVGPNQAVTTLAQNLGSNIITRMAGPYNGALYFLDGGSTTGGTSGEIRYIATTGTNQTSVMVVGGIKNMNPYYLQVDAGGAVYWIQQGASTREIHRRLGTTETVLASINSTVTPSFYVSGTTLFYYDPVAGALKSVPTTGGVAAATLATGLTVSGSPGALTVVGSTVYFSDSVNAVKSVPTGGGAVTTKVSGVLDARELVSDGASLFLYHNGGAPNRYDLSTFANTQFNDYSGNNIGMLVDAANTPGGQSVYWMTAAGGPNFYIAKMSTTSKTPFTLSVQAVSGRKPSLSHAPAPTPRSNR